jgi:hypothetical protein
LTYWVAALGENNWGGILLADAKKDRLLVRKRLPDVQRKWGELRRIQRANLTKKKVQPTSRAHETSIMKAVNSETISNGNSTTIATTRTTTQVASVVPFSLAAPSRINASYTLSEQTSSTACSATSTSTSTSSSSSTKLMTSSSNDTSKTPSTSKIPVAAQTTSRDNATATPTKVTAITHSASKQSSIPKVTPAQISPSKTIENTQPSIMLSDPAPAKKIIQVCYYANIAYYILLRFMKRDVTDSLESVF